MKRETQNFNVPFLMKVPDGLEMCVRLMLPGEVSLVHSTAAYAYDKFARYVKVTRNSRFRVRFACPKGVLISDALSNVWEQSSCRFLLNLRL